MLERVTYFFAGLTVSTHIGIGEAERSKPQRILLDIEYDALVDAAAGDDIADHVDYDGVRAEVERIASRGHFRLQETLARAIAEHLIGRDGIVRAKIRSAKPDIYPNCKAVGVVVERTKS